MLEVFTILGLAKMGYDQAKEDGTLLKWVQRYWKFRLWLAQYTRKKKRSKSR